MNKLKTSILILFFVYGSSQAQENSFEKEYGYSPKVVTLSNGKYEEFHDHDSIIEIGSALYNIRSLKIIGTVKSRLLEEFDNKPSIISRWMSIDPKAEEYSSWSPYVYVANNPIIFIDPDGRDIISALVYNVSHGNNETALWALEVNYDTDKGTGSYHGALKNKDCLLNVAGKFDANTKSNYLNADLFTEEGALGIFHNSENGSNNWGLKEPSSKNELSFDQRWNEDGLKIPTALATTIGDITNVLNSVELDGVELGEEGSDKISDMFKDFKGTVEYLKDKDGNHTFRFTVEGADVNFTLDYTITPDKTKEDEK